MTLKLKRKLNMKSVIHRRLTSREFYVDLSKADKREAKHQISWVGMRVISKTNYRIADRVLLFNAIHSVQAETEDQLN